MESQGVDHSPLGFTTTQIENWDDISETFDPALFDCFSQSANDATDVNESVNHERPAQSLGHANHPWSPLRQQNGCVRMVVLSPISVAHGSQSGDSGQSVIENTCVIAGENTTLEMANLTLNPVENASVSADASSPVLQTHSESVRYPMPLEPHITINRVATPTAVKHRRNLLKRERYCVRKTPLSPVLEEPEKPGDSNTGSANELKAYCKQDVEVLRKSCERYRDRIMDMAKKKVRRYCTEKRKNVTVTYCVDPFQHITLASVCMAIYRFKFLPKDTIAVVPSDNYHKAKKRYSTPAIQWLMYVSHSENIVIQHALRGGEKKVGNYYLDGYAYVDGRHIAFEFNGCFFHGCGVCFSANAQNNVTKTTYSQLYQASLAKMRYLQQQGYTLRVLWEHEWREMIETNSDLQAFLLKMQFPVPLEPRDALYGGRTNAIKLYHRLADGETINYYDFTSLYPFINKTKTYPIGHPTIIYEDFTYIKNYFGIAKVKVYPPRDLFFPVLPVKMNHKLMFPLCYTCALNSLSDPCSHTDEERSIVGTWCTIELEMAVEKGYRIAHTYEIWHFPETSDNLFASYIELHLRDKQEASGFPSWCTDDDKKNAYIDSFLQKEGVQLRKEEIGVNPAKRQISKLFLNSLWGKFAQKSNLPCTNIVTDPDKLFEYVFLPQYEISGLNFIDDETANVTWKYAKEHHTVNKNTNIFIACFTTAYARLELYSLLDRLQERCLYHDTDSVMFVHREGDWNPPLGDYLGELTSEIPDDTHITEFVSAGPKTYGYKLNTGKTVLKVKGITLNTSATQVVNFDSLKDLVLDYQRNSDPETQKTITVEQPGFVRDKKYWDIETRPLQKTQRCVYTKRICKEYVLPDQLSINATQSARSCEETTIRRIHTITSQC
ncbi:uncharacterized protein [Eleutherodactylus coqui]